MATEIDYPLRVDDPADIAEVFFAPGRPVGSLRPHYPPPDRGSRSGPGALPRGLGWSFVVDPDGR